MKVPPNGAEFNSPELSGGIAVEAHLALGWTLYWAVLLLLLLVERTALLPFGASEIFWQTHHWTWLVLAIEKGAATALILGTTGAALFSWQTFSLELRSLISETSLGGLKWLCIHLAVVSMVLVWTTLCHGDQIFPSPYWEIWMCVRVALELSALATWATAALPPSFWLRWITNSPGAFAAGMIFALITKMAGHYAVNLWWLFQRSTLLTVAALLRLCRQIVVVGLANAHIGTPTFSVEVGWGCSGLEGFAAVIVFMAIYFWVYRRELRFPQILLLVPVGVAIEFFLNSVRITILILLGTINQKVAVDGFHSIAGWLCVSLVACGLVTASWRVPGFTKIGSEPKVQQLSNPAGFYLVPLLVIIATGMFTKIFEVGFDLLYPLRVFATAGSFYFYRRELAAIRWSASFWAVGLGLVVFAIWVALARRNDPFVNATFAAGLNNLPTWGRSAWFFFRVIGAVVTVPIAEELAFRGYLMRKLIADDFESVRLGQFTWISFLVSSALFGALHGEWLAGALAGMVFAAALCRKGLLSDAIVTHSFANALLSAYVLATHDWSLWT